MGPGELRQGGRIAPVVNRNSMDELRRLCYNHVNELWGPCKIEKKEKKKVPVKKIRRKIGVKNS